MKERKKRSQENRGNGKKKRKSQVLLLACVLKLISVPLAWNFTFSIGPKTFKNEIYFS